MPKISTSTTHQVAQAAESWAAAHGFTSASDVPMSRAPELIQAVATATARPAGEVRDALLAAAESSAKAAASGHAALGLDASGAKASTHVALSGAGGMKPLGLQLGGGALEALSATDTRFAQVTKDFFAARIAVTEKAKPKTLDEVHRAATRVLSLFAQLEKMPGDKQVQDEIVHVYKDLLARATRERGVYLVKAPPGGWPELAVAPSAATAGATVSGGASGASAATASSGASTSSAAGLVAKDGGRGALYARVDKAAHADGTPEIDAHAPKTLGHTSGLAIDASTGRAFVVDFHGAVESLSTIEAFVASRAKHKADAAAGGPLAQNPGVVDELRSLSDAQLARLPGSITHVSLEEDDKSGLARVYPTKWYKGPHGVMSRRVIVDGPFAGVFLDDVVNKLSSEGAAFRFDPKGKGPGLPTTPKQGEPFVSTAQVMERGKLRDKLYLRVPFDRAYTELRQSMRRLSELDPHVKYDKDTKNCGFYFEPNQFETVRKVAGSLVMSGKAATGLQAHYDDLTRVELASSDAHLSKHSASAIGGFKDTVKGADGKPRAVQLSYWQKKSLAWLEASGWRGVVALDTGMGKTMAGIGAMQELRTREGEERPFLVVVPPALRGNFAKEIHKFMQPAEAEALIGQMKVLSYPEFTKAVRAGELDGKPFAPKDFGAVLFDEAQWLKSPSTTRAKAALSFDHPRKICLTASPMESSPMEAYVLSCVAQNINLHDKVEGKDHRYKMRKFKELYCTTLGGRILGLKPEVQLLPKVSVDPKHELYTWVRKNVFYADKRVDDVKLPDLELRTETLTMPKPLEEAYRKKSKAIGKVLRGMVSLYRDKGVAREYVDESGKKKVEINKLARDKRIGQMFGVRFRGLVNELNTLTNTPAKVDRAADLFLKKLETSPTSRAALFSDSAEYVVSTARQLSEALPGKLHAACLAGEIRVFQDGEELKTLGAHTLPFKQQAYRKDPSKPADPATNRQHGPDEWQSFVLSEIIGANKEFATTTLLGPVYQQGQNMQWADTGFHLDRDTWNRENTKQREARLWRKGQEQSVDFHNLDWVFKKPVDDLDRTLDQIRGYHELIASDLFAEVIERPSREVKLGENWSPVREREAFSWDFDPFALGLEPTLKHAAAGDA